jgi:phenylpropionate dioxygenase-like ring-hydroxylating dioxygenase large terminal subunit
VTPPARYPFPIPVGWFAVVPSAELASGQTRAAYFFDQHLVVWRDDAGGAHVMDAFCPHLGAHLGHGGTVEGCEIVCPFHGWQFDAEGGNTSIPYSERVNRRARIRSFPVLERNGFVFAWYHPDEAPPPWEVEPVEELASGATPAATNEYTVQAGIQELAENAVDSAHFRYVHHTATVPVIQRYESDGHRAVMESNQQFPTPRGVVDGHIDAMQDGPGTSIVRFSGIVDLLLVSASTPIDAERTHTWFHFYVADGGDGAPSPVARAFAAEVHRQFLEDMPVWEHKAHLVRPALADRDGPFMKFRAWYSQFYVDAVADERTVFPPPYWPDKLDETPAKATASARLDDRG